MLISHEREKLIELIKYFSAHTKYCGLTKLFKLLFFLDFDHFRETGRPVTGLQYEAWPMGPVPASLYEELKGKPREDLSANIHVEDPKMISQEFEVRDASSALNSWGAEEPTMAYMSRRVPAKFKAIKKFKSDLFTKREQRLMEEISYIYKELIAEQISEVSHLKGKPWDRTKREHGMKAPIDYMLALDENREGAPSKEEILARIHERQEVLRALE